MLEIVHRALAEERQPRLDAAHACTQCQITENNQVERDGSSKNGVTAQEVNLDFHRIAHPAENIDVVPCFLVILTRRIVVDAYLMINITVQVRIFLRFEDIVDNRQLADLFCLEVLRLVEYLAVTVTQNIRREPAAYTQHTGLEHRSKHRLHQSLATLEVLTGNGHIHFLGEFPHSRSIHTQIRSTHNKRSAFCNGSICIAHTRRDNFSIVFLHCLLQSSERFVLFGQRNIYFGTCSPQHSNTLAVIGCLEVTDILTQLLCHFPASSSLLNIRTVQTFCKIVVECSRHRLDGLQFVFYQIQVFLFQNLGIHSSFVGVVRENVPTAENDIIQISQRHYVFDKFFFAILHAHSSHLCD